MYAGSSVGCSERPSEYRAQDALLPVLDGQTLDRVIVESFSSRNLAVVRDTIEAAKQRPGSLSDPLSILGSAAYQGIPEAVEMLIPLVSIDQIKESGASVMGLAVCGGCLQEPGSLEVMKLLADANFPMEGELDNGDHDWALRLASRGR